MPLMVWLKDIYQGGDIEGDVPLTHTTLNYVFFVASSLRFEIYSAWTSSTEYDSDMASIFPQTWFGTQFKHAKGLEIVMGDIEHLSSYPHYWR